jgi:hypothetical protein
LDFRKLAKQVTEVAERLADVSDAARGKRRRRSGVPGRWLLLPAAGAAVYAAAKRAAVDRSAGGVVRGAKADETPDLDLLNRVKDVSGLGADRGEDDEPRLDARDLEEHRRERAARRERRRESMPRN